MISGAFIDRPRLSLVISLVIMLAGGLSMLTLPVTQYPNIAPPSVSISATYPGADATVVAEAVGAPIERAVNGVEGMTSLSSTSSNAGTYSGSVEFEIGTDPDIAQVNVSNRVQLATSQLPSSVTEQGVSVTSQASGILMAVGFALEEGADISLQEAATYVSTQVTTAISRINGVGNAQVLGPTDYAMRVWTNPDRLAAFDLSPSDVADAIRQSNVAAALGQVGGAPAVNGQAVTYTVTGQGRLSEPEAFGEIVIRSSEEGGLVRLRDVARVELGSASYSTNAFLNGRPGLSMTVNQAPGANAIAVAAAVRDELSSQSESFPAGLTYQVVYDSTDFVVRTIQDILVTLLLTAMIIVAVVYTFLQGVRVTVIPIIAIPVSLIGTFAGLLALGFSINVITLLALILSIGIVVDDAILVVENVRRVMEENPEMSRGEAAKLAMREITGPVIATTLVLLAVFVPTTFLPGLTGQLYKQFGIALVISVVLSSVVALTLTPSLCGSLLKRREEPMMIFRWFNSGLVRTRNGYGRIVGFLVRRTTIAVVVLAGAIGVALWTYSTLPQALVPTEDQGAILVDVSLPDGASLQRSTAAMQEIGDIIRSTDGVADSITVAGFSFLGGQRTSVGIAFAVLEPWGERRPLFPILGELNAAFSQLPGLQVAAFPPPSIPGTGSVGGLSMQVQAQQGQSAAELSQVVRSVVSAANGRPEIAGARSTFSADVPRIYVDVDRDRSDTLNLSVASIYDTLGQTLGSGFVNQFIYDGRVYQVQIQSEARSRSAPEDINALYVQNASGNSVPLSAVTTLRTEFGPYILPRYNLFTAAEITAQPAQGYATGQAISALQAAASEVLPEGYGVTFSGAAAQQQESSAVTPLAFGLAFIFAFLFLVGQFESWFEPLAVMLSVGIAAAGATLALLFTGTSANVYAQIGMVMLIGLAAKNAILIVEFSKNRLAEGRSITEAAIMGARQRFRAVMMTTLSFIFGLLPLVLASGAGAASRQSIGIAAVGGMLAATLVGIMIIPPIWALLRRLGAGESGVLWGTERDPHPDDSPGQTV